jgi:hypothetical protein
MQNIRVRLSFQEVTAAFTIDLDANPMGAIKPCDNAAFGAQPQGYGLANRLAASSMAAEVD